MPQGRSSFTWYNGLSTEFGLDNQEPIPRLLNFSGASVAARGGEAYFVLYGHDYAESTIVTAGVPQEFVDAVEREKQFERCVGDISVRMANPFDINVGQLGSNPLWVCRTGFAVVASDGNLGIAPPSLNGRNTADAEFSWLHTDQFVVSGVDRGDIDFADIQNWSSSADGLNNYVVTRHYDVRVGRRLEKNDVLLFVFAFSLFVGSAAAINPANLYAGALQANFRVLGRALG